MRVNFICTIIFEMLNICIYVCILMRTFAQLIDVKIGTCMYIDVHAYVCTLSVCAEVGDWLRNDVKAPRFCWS